MAEITIREAGLDDAEGMAAVHIASWQTSYTELVPAETLANLDVERRAALWRESLSKETKGKFDLVAETEEGKIVGFVSGGPAREMIEDFQGEVYAIYLLEAYKRQGIGRRLMEAAVRRLLDNGMGSMMLWVLKDNDSRGFYEQLGGIEMGKKQFEIGGKVLDGVGYGWEDAIVILEEKE
jgi:L-amino acid N-acyltransferase YncA